MTPIEALFTLVGIVSIIVGLILLDKSFAKKYILPSQFFIFLGTSLVLYFYAKPQESLFGPVDSFTIGSIAFLITTTVNKKAQDYDGILLLSGIGTIAYFLSGFIGATTKIFPANPYPLLVILFASLQNSLFFLGSINLTLSAVQFIASQIIKIKGNVDFKGNTKTSSNETKGLSYTDFIILLLAPLLTSSIVIVGGVQTLLSGVIATLISAPLLILPILKVKSIPKKRAISFFYSLSILAMTNGSTSTLWGIPFLILYFEQITGLYSNQT